MLIFKALTLAYDVIDVTSSVKKHNGLANLENIVAEVMFLGWLKLGNTRFGSKICVCEAKMFLT